MGSGYLRRVLADAGGPALLQARRKMETTQVTPRGQMRERELSMGEMRKCGQGARREPIS
jgi:hypothetical protein